MTFTNICTIEKNNKIYNLERNEYDIENNNLINSYNMINIHNIENNININIHNIENNINIPNIENLNIPDIENNINIPNIENLNINNMNINNHNNMNINNILSNPNQYGLIGDYDFKYENNNIDNIVNDINKLNLRNHKTKLNLEEDNINDKYELDDEFINKESNPLYEKFVPIEVANFYCREYFDDEDFIHMTFELPNELLDNIMTSGRTTVEEYFKNEIDKLIPQSNEIEVILYYEMYSSCIIVFDTIMEYYLPTWYSYDYPHDKNDYSKFNKQWTNNCRNMLSATQKILQLGINDDTLNYLCTYNKEVYMGLFIIINRLENLFSYFNNVDSVNEFVDYNKDYRNIIIRLVNNLCIILLYIKFYYLNYYVNTSNNSQLMEQTPRSDYMITIED
jgi:hypothetical protein